MALAEWAVPQLSKILPLDEQSLQEIVTYTDTLTRQAASDHLINILGDSPQALEFITSFQQRRPRPPAEASTTNPISNNPSRDASDAEVPRPSARPKKKKQNIHQLPARQVEHAANTPGGYIKKDEDDYMSGNRKPRSQKEPPLANTLALESKPEMLAAPPQQPFRTSPSQSPAPSKLPPSAAGSLISDSLPNSRSSSPANKSRNQHNQSTKINITGGASMRGASTTLSDLDSAIRSLEMSTNPSLMSPADNEARKCNCMAQRHALLSAAPNCLSCGKIICAKEGLGPCTFCSKPLLKNEDVQEMLRSLREERGRERQAAGNAANKKAEVSKAPRPFSGSNTPLSSTPGSTTSPQQSATAQSEEDKQLALAKQHRDRLLSYQSQNARRTRIRDEAADFETPDVGLSQWASPQERALQLKRQQKILREQEYNAKPEWEKRKMVVSLDVDSRGKARATRSFMKENAPKAPAEDEEDDDNPAKGADQSADGQSKGTFSRNPLLGGLIRPTFTPKEDKGKARDREKKPMWRRVQDDYEDNEEIILDGGAYGDRIDGRVLAAEETAHG